MSIDLLYLGSLREALGRDRERVDPPSHVLTVADLVAWMGERGGAYEAAFAPPADIRAAVEAEMAGADATIFGARQIAFFPPPGAL